MYLYGCTFYNHNAKLGGTIYGNIGQLKNSKIEKSVADKGGGFYRPKSDFVVRIVNSTFIDCSADQGGAIYEYGAINGKDNDKYIDSSSFVNCIATYGGALYLYQFPLFFQTRNSTFESCHATDSVRVFWPD